MSTRDAENVRAEFPVSLGRAADRKRPCDGSIARIFPLGVTMQIRRRVKTARSLGHCLRFDSIAGNIRVTGAFAIEFSPDRS